MLPEDMVTSTPAVGRTRGHSQVHTIEEGSFFGVGKHKDGSDLGLYFSCFFFFLFSFLFHHSFFLLLLVLFVCFFLFFRVFCFSLCDIDSAVLYNQLCFVYSDHLPNSSSGVKWSESLLCMDFARSRRTWRGS